ncbi:ATP-grasp domain-containing protein [Candidatus Dojkabacteria bacterium]|nr:ATP-grasp domain-containing protein [Candidatus Dojkabacteria bacterium]
MRVLISPSIENFDLVEKHFEDIVFDKTYSHNLRFIFTENGPKVLYKDMDCKNYDLAWISSYWTTQDLAYALHLYLERNSIPHTKVKRAGSKIVDHMVFSLNNIPSPNTFFRNSTIPKKYLDEAEETCGYPMVIKDTMGCRGRNSHLVHNRKELEKATLELPEGHKFMFQQYIPNEYDWGVLVSRGKVVAAEKSFPKKGEFRNNACNGAKEVFVDVKECPDNVKEIAVKAATALNLNWCRSDIVVDKNRKRPYLLEVNRYPGITKGTDEVKAVVKFMKELTQKFKS